jgi:hypothetical protein
MPWRIYDRYDYRRENTVRGWLESLQKPDRIRMDKKIDLLEANGGELSPGLLAGPLNKSRHIYKLRVNGRVAPRLLLCKGPIQMETEFTLLVGVFERDGELPEGIEQIAEEYRLAIIADPERRCLHERVKR